MRSNNRSSAAQGLGEIVTLVWRNIGAAFKWRLLLTALLVLIASTLTALGPVALKLVVDEFTRTDIEQSLSPFMLIGFYVLSQFIARTLNEVRGLVFNLTERRIFRIVTERLFAHVMRLPMRFHLNRQTGAIAQILSNGIRGYNLVLQHFVFTLLPVLIELCTVMIVLIQFRQPTFLVLFSLAIVGYAVAYGAFAVRISEVARRASGSDVEVAAAITDAISNYETVKYFDAEEEVQAKLNRVISRNESEWAIFFRRYAQNGVAAAAVYVVFVSAISFVAALKVQRHQMSIGDFILVTTYMVQVARPIEMLGLGMQAFSQGLAMLQKMLDLLREKIEPAAELSRTTFDGGGTLRFEHVSLSYGPGRVVLTDVSFILPAGRTVAIVGASGAGKSSVVRLLVRLLEPDSGRILLDGVPTSRLPLSLLRRAIAVVPQDTVLFNDTISANIAFGSPGCSQREIEGAARLAHLHEFIMSLPERYETPVGERGIRLSGGERQRISIARAALKRPRIFVFDEATSSLDSHTEQEILADLHEIFRTTTNLMIAHRLSTVMHANEIIVFGGGSIIERGSHATLLQSDGSYASLWRKQHRGA